MFKKFGYNGNMVQLSLFQSRECLRNPRSAWVSTAWVSTPWMLSTACMLSAVGMVACVQIQGVDHSGKGGKPSNISVVPPSGSGTGGDEEQTPYVAGTWNVGPGELGTGGRSSSGKTGGGKGGARSGAGGSSQEDELGEDPSGEPGEGTTIVDVPEEGCTPDKVFELPLAGAARPTVDPIGEGEFCVAISGPITGWECHGIEGRVVTVNNQPAQCGSMVTLPGPLNDGFRYFKISALSGGTGTVYYTGGIGWW